MKISSHGGIIAAANENMAFPLHRVGDTSAVRRIVLCFQQAGIFPIVVIAGAEEDQVRYQLSSSGVVFLHPQQTELLELFGSAKAGFTFLKDVCDRIVFTPVNTPMFSPGTLHALMQAKGQIVSPSYNRHSGHPIILSTQVIPEILAWQGENGLRGAVDAMHNRRTWVEVEDKGILYTVHHGDIPEQQLKRQDAELLNLSVEMRLQKDRIIFDARAKLLLLLILKTQSVRAACKQMALSYSKAWEILNALEKSLEAELVTRKHGGAKGGRTTLTKQGVLFLREYQRLEEDVVRFTQDKFSSLKTTLLPY